VSLGLDEALTYSFVSPRDLALLGAPAPSVVLVNPISEERTVMRTSLLPGLLEALRRARRRGERAVRQFAIGARFLAPLTAETTSAAPAARPRVPADLGTLPEERASFAAVLAGPRPMAREDLDVYDAKGVAVELLERVTGRRAEVRLATGASDLGHLHPRARAEVLVEGLRMGSFGPLHPDLVDAFDLDGGALVVELDLPALEAIGLLTPRFSPIPRLPAVTRDISLEVGEAVLAGTLEQAMRGAAGELCESVDLLDVFTGGPVPAGSRSLTFRVTYRDPKAAADPDRARTLTDKEVDACHGKVRSAVEKLGARPRE
jgi:phenylalanyl-tRNA synthetase beta chain